MTNRRGDSGDERYHQCGKVSRDGFNDNRDRHAAQNDREGGQREDGEDQAEGAQAVNHELRDDNNVAGVQRREKEQSERAFALFFRDAIGGHKRAISPGLGNRDCAVREARVRRLDAALDQHQTPVVVLASVPGHRLASSFSS